MAAQLVARGSPVDSTDAQGRTPLVLALAGRHDRVARLLLADGKAAVTPRDVTGQTGRWGWATGRSPPLY